MVKSKQIKNKSAGKKTNKTSSSDGGKFSSSADLPVALLAEKRCR